MIHLNLYKRIETKHQSLFCCFCCWWWFWWCCCCCIHRVLCTDKSSKYSRLKQCSTCQTYILHTNSIHTVHIAYSFVRTAENSRQREKLRQKDRNVFTTYYVSLVHSTHLQQLLSLNAYGFHVIHVTTVCKYNYILKWQKLLWMHCNKEKNK